MKENLAKEELRTVKIFKDYGLFLVFIVGTVWSVWSIIVSPQQKQEIQLAEMNFKMDDSIGNHLKTIQDEQVVATKERESQRITLEEMNARLVRMETLMEQIAEKN